VERRRARRRAALPSIAVSSVASAKEEAHCLAVPTVALAKVGPAPKGLPRRPRPLPSSSASPPSAHSCRIPARNRARLCHALPASAKSPLPTFRAESRKALLYATFKYLIKPNSTPSARTSLRSRFAGGYGWRSQTVQATQWRTKAARRRLGEGGPQAMPEHTRAPTKSTIELNILNLCIMACVSSTCTDSSP
jgi:hypothetical protein